jgi:TolB-like protein
MKCPHCRFENVSDTRFCGNCGNLLHPASPDPAGAAAAMTRIPRGEIVPGGDFAGRYTVVDELGRGGMGRVYKALDKEINETVALKVLVPGLALDERLIERFRNELKLARRIAHKNVCRIFDLGNFEGTYFITMEYVAGDTLRSILRMTGPLGAPRALAIAGQVCDGLAEAHRLGVVHRDLKSANIMIDREGDARIMDFGIARDVGAKDRTDRGALVGTPDYMAPEQVEGLEIDRRADIYSFGVILFEMATGRLPFEGPTPLSVALMHKTARPPDTRELNAQVPDGLSAAIARCLEKDRGSRFQRIEELAAALHGVAEEIEAPAAVRPRPKADTLRPGGTPALRSVAVLPFADLSPRKDQDYFCQGLAEEIITALAKIPELEVAAKSSAFSAEFRTMDVREVGRRLGVAAVLEGSVRKVENRLRITAQLLNVANGYHLWSEKYDRTFEDIFAIQDEITRAIVENLRLKFLGEEKAPLLKRTTDNPEAYNLYLKGRYFWNKRTGEGLKRALECFAQAIQADPAFVRAYAGISDCYGILALYYLPPRPTLMKAKGAAERAVELDEALPEAHTSIAFVKQKLERDWAGAEKEYRRAIELEPDYLWSHHWYSLFLAAMGRHQESFAEVKRALEIDPTMAQVTMIHGMDLYLARYYERAVEELQKAVELDPQHVLATFYLGVAHVELGHFEQALAQIERAGELGGGAGFFVQGIGYVHASAGRKDLAQAVLARLAQIADKTYLSPYFTALIHFRLGENDRGFEALDRAFDEGDHWLEFLRVFPVFDGVRTDPRYAALVEKLKLE